MDNDHGARRPQQSMTMRIILVRRCRVAARPATVQFYPRCQYGNSRKPYSPFTENDMERCSCPPAGNSTRKALGLTIEPSAWPAFASSADPQAARYAQFFRNANRVREVEKICSAARYLLVN